MAAIESRNLIHRDGSLSSASDDMEEDSPASLLASVKEQEQQFAILTKEIEEERRTVAQQLNHDQYNDMNYREDMEDNYYGTPPGERVTETFSRREDYGDPREETEVLVDENGVSRTVTKRIVTKTVTERRVRQVEDTDSLPRNNHSDPRYSGRHPSERSNSDSDRKYNSMHRNHNSVPSPYDDENRGLLQPGSSESSVGSDDGRKPSGYSYPPPRGSVGSNNDGHRQTQPEKFQPEDYGLEDDRQSDYNDDDDQYGLEPNAHNQRKRSVSSDTDDSDHHRYGDQMEPVAPSRSIPPSHIGRAPLAMQEAGSRGSLDRLDAWQTPTLEEVIKMLSYNMPVVQQHAAAYIQHLSFNDDKVKSDVRTLGGIPPLIKLLDNGNEKVELNAIGALRNLCHGSRNDKNKIEIKNHEGVPAVIKLIRSTKNIDTREKATGTLWNMSAHPELKGQVLELGLQPLTNLIIVPFADAASGSGKPEKVEMLDVFTNTVGVVRHLSSTDTTESRRRLRECDGLLLSLISALHANKENDNINNKATENCLCVLRNLTYKLQDETPNAQELYGYDKPRDPNTEKSSLSCFGNSKSKDQPPEVVEQIPPDDPDALGAALLWQPKNSRLYVSILQECHPDQQDIIEASLGALQNLTSGVWKWAAYARAVVRKDKGLPSIIDRLRTDNDQIVRVGTTTLTNLAEDFKNKELIGKFAMKDLVYKLPGGSDPNIRLSDITTIAVLNTIRILVEHSPDNVRHLRDAGGVERVTTINNSRDNSRFHARVVKAAGQVLRAIWANKSTQSLLKKDGWNKNHFTPTVTIDTLPRNSSLNRPYEEPRSNPGSSGGRRAQRNANQSPEEIPLTLTEPRTSDSTRRKEVDSYV